LPLKATAERWEGSGVFSPKPEDLPACFKPFLLGLRKGGGCKFA